MIDFDFRQASIDCTAGCYSTASMAYSSIGSTDCCYQLIDYFSFKSCFD